METPPLHFPRQTLPMLDHALCEEILPKSPIETSPGATGAIPLHLISCHLRKEANTLLAASSFQVVVESSKVSPQPAVLQTSQPQVPLVLFSCPFISSVVLL